MLLYSAAKRRQGAPHSWPVGPSRATGRDRSGRDDLWLRYEPIVEEVAQAKGTQENPHQEEETGSEVARSAIELLLVGAKQVIFSSGLVSFTRYGSDSFWNSAQAVSTILSVP